MQAGRRVLCVCVCACLKMGQCFLKAALSAKKWLVESRKGLKRGSAVLELVSLVNVGLHGNPK